MSKTNKNVNKNKVDKKNTKPEKRDYKNPIESVWGKILIWVLIFGMIGIVIISSIYAILGGLGII